MVSQRNEIRLAVSPWSRDYTFDDIADEPASCDAPLVTPDGNSIITSYLFAFAYPSLDALCCKNAFREPNTAPPKTFEKLNLDIKSSS